MELIFVTANSNKAIEVQKVIGDGIKILSLKGIGFAEDIEETGSTLTENALIKARFIYNRYKKNCFADDSGLEVNALNNEPGVYSARYAGEPKSDLRNTRKLLENLQNISNRAACFKTVIALIIDGNEFTFEGKIEGDISIEPRGNNGFGYDPVFIPKSFNKTFAEMSSEEKNAISHRAIAVNKMNDFLKNLS